MCVLSMIGDHYTDKFNSYPSTLWSNGPTREEFELLKREVQEMKELLKRAKAYDEEHNEPDCELAEKMEKLRKVAELVGIDLNDVLKS